MNKYSLYAWDLSQLTDLWQKTRYITYITHITWVNQWNSSTGNRLKSARRRRQQWRLHLSGFAGTAPTIITDNIKPWPLRKKQYYMQTMIVNATIGLQNYNDWTALYKRGTPTLWTTRFAKNVQTVKMGVVTKKTTTSIEKKPSRQTI